MKEFRKRTGLSQKQFSEYFDIPIRTLQDWEQGRRTPPDYILKMIERIWILEKN